MADGLNPGTMRTGADPLIAAAAIDRGALSAALAPIASIPSASVEDTAEREFLTAWLRRQCEALPAARSGLVLCAVGRALLPVTVWPASEAPPPALTRIAERAASSPQPIIAWARPSGGAGASGQGTLDLLIGLAVHHDNALAAVIAVAIAVPGGIDSLNPDQPAGQLQLGAGWLEAHLTRRQARSALARTERAAVAMDIVAVASQQRRPTRAAIAVVNELAARLGCDRVSLGVVRRGGVKLRATSHAASFQERGRIVDAIEDAMEECLAQSAAIAWPATDGTKARVSVAHRHLSALDPVNTATASVVLPGAKQPVGVLTFERRGGEAFDGPTLALAEAAGALLGPVLGMQLTNDRMIAGRIVDSAADAVTAVTGPRRPALKLAVVAGFAALTWLTFATAEYRVTARAVLEGEAQRVAAAPFEGFIAAAPARPGDRLKAGGVLAVMDDRDLVLERARAWADTERLRQKYNEAVAKHDRPNTAMLAAQIEQAQAQLALAEDKLKRATIVSPIDGLVVSGDLSQMLGSPVERGKTLFEIVPLDQYRVVLRVDEKELRFLSPGQHGQLILAGMPGARQAFTVTRVTPIAEAKEGRNEFRVEATLDDAHALTLRPGMEGVAKVETGSRSLLWGWTHGLAEWLRLTAWKWLP